MLDELLSREALKKEVDYYDSEIAKLTQEISDKQDISAVHQRQFDSIKEYIRQVNLIAEHDSDDTEFYSQLLKKAVVIDRNSLIQRKLFAMDYIKVHWILTGQVRYRPQKRVGKTRKRYITLYRKQLDYFMNEHFEKEADDEQK